MRVLVIEDERRMAAAMARGLRARGFDVSLAHDGHTGYRLARDGDVDVIVLDLMLPGMSGQEVCRRLRDEGFWTPVLVLTALDRESDETASLELGADDYLRKPFSFPVLVARCRALGRRGPAETPAEVVVGDLVLDPRRRTVRRGDDQVPLTPREFALLEFLARHAGEVCSKEEILAGVWGDTTVRDPNVVEVYIGYLRRKLEASGARSGTTRRRPARPRVGTVRGRGYQLEGVP